MTDADTRVTPESLGLLIKETQQALHQQMDEVLRPLGLTVSQYAVLENLHQAPGLTSSELARRTFVSRQSANVLLQGLERRGLVERAEAPGPRRERGTVLAGEAVALLDQAREGVHAVTVGMTAGLDSAQAESLAHTLRACRDALAAGPARQFLAG